VLVIVPVLTHLPCLRACVRRRPLHEALSFPRLMHKFAHPTKNEQPVYIPWVEPLPLQDRVDTTHAMERSGFAACLRHLAPKGAGGVPIGAFVIKPPGDCEWPSGWEGSELHGIYCSDPNLPEVLNWLLKSEEQAERGEVSDGMNAIQAAAYAPTAVPMAASTMPAAAASSTAIS
jgi:hypothetical protein